MSTQNISEPARVLPGYRFISDTGGCEDHGFFLPKQKVLAMKSVSNDGIEYVDVEISELCGILENLAEEHNERLIKSKTASFGSGV